MIWVLIYHVCMIMLIYHIRLTRQFLRYFHTEFLKFAFHIQHHNCYHHHRCHNSHGVYCNIVLSTWHIRFLHQALLELTNLKWFWWVSMNQITRLYHCWVNLINWVSEKADWWPHAGTEGQYSASERVSLINVPFLSMACEDNRQFPSSLIHGRQW